MLLEPGHIIDGKYRLVRLLGTGGMGAVYEGENLLIRRRVAIKVLHASSSNASVDAIRRFEREAQAAGEIGNDHILEVLDLGSLPNDDRYMVMEYLDGETLAARIERHGRLTPHQIAPIARQFLTALASAHMAGIIHRDLKPENIFILRSKAGRADFVKLIDFGISKFSRPFNEGEHRMTRADAVLGTPCYMSPEQARGARETDVRSDIYSCGVILYESVTGKLPFEGETFNDLMFKIALTDAPSPLSVVPSLDPEFAWLINRAIARDPEARFASAQDFSEALDDWMRRNALTETLSLPRPTDAFPTRSPAITRAYSSSSADLVDLDVVEEPADQPAEAAVSAASTASLGVADTDPMKKTGAHESWSRSRGESANPRRRGRKLAFVSVGGALLAVLAIAFLIRADPTSGAAATAASAQPTASAQPPPSAAPAPAPSAVESAPAEKGAAPPETTAPAVSAAAPSISASAKHDTKPPAHTSSAEKPKPRPAASSTSAPTKGFDLGY